MIHAYQLVVLAPYAAALILVAIPGYRVGAVINVLASAATFAAFGPNAETTIWMGSSGGSKSWAFSTVKWVPWRSTTSPVQSARITAMGLPLGTPAYMSPEQIQGDDADARSDIYGLGCVIYEMATGSPPFIGNLGQVMRMHVNDAVTPPSQKRPGLPSPLDKLVAKALAKKPGDRYQKAEDLVRDLEVIQAIATLEATTEGEAVREPKSAWRKLLDKLGGA